MNLHQQTSNKHLERQGTASNQNLNPNRSKQYNTPDISRNKPIKGQEVQTCTVCRRQFSWALIEQHMKTCQKRWAPSHKVARSPSEQPTGRQQSPNAY